MKRILPLLAAYAALAFMSACSSDPNEDTPEGTFRESTTPTTEDAETIALRLTSACAQWDFARDTIDNFGPASADVEALEIGRELSLLQETAADTDIRQAAFAFSQALWNRDQHQMETYRQELNDVCNSFGENDSTVPVAAVE